MMWIRNKLKNKVIKRVLAFGIAAGLGYAGFSDELAKQFASEGAGIIIEQIAE
jgi:hypothetical protein